VPDILEGVSDVLKAYGDLPQTSMQYLPLQIATAGTFMTLIFLAYMLRKNKTGLFIVTGIIGILSAVIIYILLERLTYS
jgi:hypothetical protein